MSRFRLFSMIFAFWGVLFLVFARFANEYAAIGYVTSRHAEDWTRIVGLFAFGFAVLLDQAHRSASVEVRRAVARGVIAFTIPCAILMTAWQITADPRWTRLDIGNILLLGFISWGLWMPSRLPGLGRP